MGAPLRSGPEIRADFQSTLLRYRPWVIVSDAGYGS